jgi:hypothetical protein
VLHPLGSASLGDKDIFADSIADLLLCWFYVAAVIFGLGLMTGPAHSIRYEAESPDEAALVVAAKVFGFRLTKRTNTILTLQEELPKGSHLERQYEVLNLLEFNSTRKRMSVIIRTPEDKIILYCKVWQLEGMMGWWGWSGPGSQWSLCDAFDVAGNLQSWVFSLSGTFAVCW